MLPTFFRGETAKSMEESEESGKQCNVAFALIVTKPSRGVADSPSRGVVFRPENFREFEAKIGTARKVV